MSTACTAQDPRYLALIQLLRTSETIVNASRSFFARWDLTPGQFNVLKRCDELQPCLVAQHLSRSGQGKVGKASAHLAGTALGLLRWMSCFK
jgi:hypothetical protein